MNDPQSPNEAVDPIHLSGTPYNLSPMLTQLLDRYISMLVKSCNTDIHAGMIRGIKNYAKFKDISCLACPWSATLPLGHKYKMLSIARRCALTKAWKRFCRKALSKTMSAEVKESNKQYFCTTIGFNGNNHYCRSPFCPNCAMRTANGTRKDIIAQAAKQDPKTLPAIVVSVAVPFKEHLYGYTPVKQPPVVELLRRKLTMPYYACKTIGATLENRYPFSVTKIAFFVNQKNTKQLQHALNEFRQRLLRQSAEISVEIESVSGVDNICLALYDCSPLCLAGLSKEGFSDCVLQHTIEEYKCANKNKKRTMFFGSRSD